MDETQSPRTETPHLLSLSDEVLTKILNHLSPKEKLRLESVCVRTRTLLKSSSFWQVPYMAFTKEPQDTVDIMLDEEKPGSEPTVFTNRKKKLGKLAFLDLIRRNRTALKKVTITFYSYDYLPSFRERWYVNSFFSDFIRVCNIFNVKLTLLEVIGQKFFPPFHVARCIENCSETLEYLCVDIVATPEMFDAARACSKLKTLDINVRGFIEPENMPSGGWDRVLRGEREPLEKFLESSPNLEEFRIEVNYLLKGEVYARILEHLSTPIKKLHLNIGQNFHVVNEFIKECLNPSSHVEEKLKSVEELAFFGEGPAAASTPDHFHKLLAILPSIRLYILDFTGMWWCVEKLMVNYEWLGLMITNFLKADGGSDLLFVKYKLPEGRLSIPRIMEKLDFEKHKIDDKTDPEWQYPELKDIRIDAERDNAKVNLLQIAHKSKKVLLAIGAYKGEQDGNRNRLLKPYVRRDDEDAIEDFSDNDEEEDSDASSGYEDVHGADGRVIMRVKQYQEPECVIQ